jgi:hypothetical protein
MYFTSRVDRILMRVDEHGNQLVHSISAEGLSRIKRAQSKPIKIADRKQAA